MGADLNVPNAQPDVGEREHERNEPGKGTENTVPPAGATLVAEHQPQNPDHHPGDVQLIESPKGCFADEPI
jgi:hypothetical protein